MPKVPESKPCGSKQAAALTKSPPAPGWSCRSWARLGSPAGRDGLLHGDMGNAGSMPLPAGEPDAWVQKWFEFLVGTAETSINQPFCSPLGFLLPLGAVALPCLVLVLPQQGFSHPVRDPVSPVSTPPPTMTLPCLQCPLGSQGTHGLAQQPSAQPQPGTMEHPEQELMKPCTGGEFGIGASPPSCPQTPPRCPGVKDLTWLMAHVCLCAVSERLGNTSRPSPCPKSRLGP